MNEYAIDKRPLDHPVALVVARSSALDAVLAKVEVSVVASPTVIMRVGDGGVARIAADSKFAIPRAAAARRRRRRLDRGGIHVRGSRGCVESIE